MPTIRSFAISLLLAGTAASQTPKQSLLVLSKHDHTLSIVDPHSLKVVATAPVGIDPHEVVASSDGNTAFVSIYGGGAYHAINVIDLEHAKARNDIDTGAMNGPHGLDYVGGKLWFTAEGAKAVGRLNTSTGTVEWIMGTGQDRTHMLRVTPDQKTIYTTNVSSGTISILEEKQIQPRTTWEQTVIPVGRGDEGFDVTPNGHELWTANAQDGTLSVVDLATRHTVATLQANVRTANRLRFTLDGKYALISMLSGGDLVVYDVATRKEFKRIPIGHGAAGLLMEPGGKRAFVSCGPDNYVAVIDLQTWKVLGHISAGGEPDGLAWASRQ